MQLDQIQVSLDRMQDRLLLRISTKADEEYRVWFTRRFLRELWPYLLKCLPAGPAAPATAGEPSNTDAQPGAVFDQPFRNVDYRYPLGATPILASEANVTLSPDGNVGLTLREGRERAFNVNLTPDMLHSVCAMLRASAAQATWDLPLDYAPLPTPGSEPLPAGTAPGNLLH